MFHVEQSTFFIPFREAVPEIVTGYAPGSLFALSLDVERGTRISCDKVVPREKVEDTIFPNIAFVYIVFHMTLSFKILTSL